MAVVSWLSNDNEVTKNKIRDDNIAPIELNASSASKTYTVGKRFVLDSDGKLYKATQQINQGSAIITSGANVNCVEDTEKILDNLGTASTKNSTSVVTESTDLVESGAVYDALGFGNKNLLDPDLIHNDIAIYESIYVGDGTFTLSTNCPQESDIACLFLLAGRQTGGGTTSTNGVWNGQPRTVNSVDGYVTVMSRLVGSVNPQNYNNQLEKGSTATAFEPYHASVEESLAEKCDNTVIASTENGSTASQAYAVGTHAIRNGAFITWKNAKAQGETINDASDYTSGDVASLLSVDTSGRIIAHDSNVTVDSYSVLKNGNVVCAKFTFTLANAITPDANTQIADISIPPYDNYLPLATLIKSGIPYNPIDCVAWVGASGNINLRANLEAGTYQAYVTYICK